MVWVGGLEITGWCWPGSPNRLGQHNWTRDIWPMLAVCYPLSSSPLWLLSIDIIFFYALAAGGAEFLGACQVLVTVAHWNKFVHLSSDNIYTNIFHFSNQCKCMEISFKRNMTWRIFKMNKDIYDPNFVQCNALVFALQSPSHSTSPLIQWLSVVEACFDLRVTFAA